MINLIMKHHLGTILFFIYLRRSKETKKEDSISIQQQYDRIRAFLIEIYKYEIPAYNNVEKAPKEELRKYGIYVENKSAFKVGRDEFNIMVQDAKKAKKQCLLLRFVIWKASRLARNRQDAQRIVDFAYDPEEKVEFICLEKNYPRTINGRHQLEKDLLESIKESAEKSRDGKYNFDTAITQGFKIPH